ncbi:Lipid A export permease/ATP-binding protein MsbA [Neorhizobium galegae bv. officinalis]|uniref:Lipid A export permease/ATP-binding protein MsbA n=1 Tax=Neorhizobium galegae bv. officinalis TaxID=323656 RepID=A0A0T7G106_NEOGA|nr:ABC transporter ATP-binding protein [Neorhizobium galegae]CDZ40985.1 Lipid A export permease/ATP-binding protein MsbA [Neorhizobium galegae bv. officinalis]
MNAKKNHLDSGTVTSVLKRVIAENGRDHIRGYAFAIFCLIATAMSTAFTAWIMESVVNEAFANKRADMVLVICFAIFAAFVVRGLATYGQAVTLSKIGNNIVARYQQRLYSHLMKLSVGFFAESRSARLAGQVNQNIGGIKDLLNLVVTSTARDMLTLVSLIVVMVLKDWVLSLIVFAVAPPLILAIRYLSQRLRNVTREAVEVSSKVLGAMQETIQGITVVKAFTMEQQLEQKVQRIIETSERQSNRIARLSERTAPLTETFAGVAISSVIGYAAFRSIYDDVAPGAFFAFITALLMAYDPARRLARMQVQIERAVVNARMIYSLLDMQPLQRENPNAPDLVVTNAQIELKGVVFTYGSGAPILKGVDLIAEGGKTTALVGPSGAGKSTIISLIPRFYDPAEGQILIDGQDIANVTKASLRHSLAYVTQQPYLFEGSIRDNIRYGRPEATDAEVEEAARLAHAHDFILMQPAGYETPVGEHGMTLSGGQRQRLSIARALVRNAPILLLDEATSALDNESEAAVQRALDSAMHGRTVVVIAHRLSTIVNADKIIVMHEGRAVEEGTHEELATRTDGLYARLNNLQSPEKVELE